MSSNKIIAAALAAEVSSIRVTQTLGIRNGGISPESQSNTEVPRLDVDMTAVMEGNDMENLRLQLTNEFETMSIDAINVALSHGRGLEHARKILHLRNKAEFVTMTDAVINAALNHAGGSVHHAANVLRFKLEFGNFSMKLIVKALCLNVGNPHGAHDTLVLISDMEKEAVKWIFQTHKEDGDRFNVAEFWTFWLTQHAYPSPGFFLAPFRRFVLHYFIRAAITNSQFDEAKEMVANLPVAQQDEMYKEIKAKEEKAKNHAEEPKKEEEKQ